MKIDTIIALNLLSLGVISSGYALSVASEIPAMGEAIANPTKLYAMPEPIYFEKTPLVVPLCEETDSDGLGDELCVEAE